MNDGDTPVRYHIARLSPIIGATVDSLVVSGDWDVYTGLIVTTRDGRRMQLIALSDPEGNGPGHIDLLELEPNVKRTVKAGSRRTTS